MCAAGENLTWIAPMVAIKRQLCLDSNRHWANWPDFATMVILIFRLHFHSVRSLISNLNHFVADQNRAVASSHVFLYLKLCFVWCSQCVCVCGFVLSVLILKSCHITAHLCYWQLSPSATQESLSSLTCCVLTYFSAFCQPFIDPSDRPLVCPTVYRRPDLGQSAHWPCCCCCSCCFLVRFIGLDWCAHSRWLLLW